MQKFNTKWNWGAFLNPIWFAIANKSWLLLLTLIPVFNLFWIFYGGFHAEQWALENSENNYRDEIEFRKIMDGWNIAGLVMFAIYAIMFMFYFMLIGATFNAILTM